MFVLPKSYFWLTKVYQMSISYFIQHVVALANLSGSNLFSERERVVLTLAKK